LTVGCGTSFGCGTSWPSRAENDTNRCKTRPESLRSRSGDWRATRTRRGRAGSAGGMCHGRGQPQCKWNRWQAGRCVCVGEGVLPKDLAHVQQPHCHLKRPLLRHHHSPAAESQCETEPPKTAGECHAAIHTCCASRPGVILAEVEDPHPMVHAGRGLNINVSPCTTTRSRRSILTSNFRNIIPTQKCEENVKINEGRRQTGPQS